MVKWGKDLAGVDSYDSRREHGSGSEVLENSEKEAQRYTWDYADFT